MGWWGPATFKVRNGEMNFPFLQYGHSPNLMGSRLVARTIVPVCTRIRGRYFLSKDIRPDHKSSPESDGVL